MIRKYPNISSSLSSKKAKEQAGFKAEEKVYFLLSRYGQINKLHHHIISRFAFSSGKSSREPDFVFICEKGIFVIEVKYWAGVIKGSAIDNDWFVYSRYGTTKRKNPLQQNKIPVNKIETMLNNKYPVRSLVVFVSNNALQLKIPLVVNFDDLIPYLDRYKPTHRLSISEIEDAYSILDNRKKTDNISIQEHKQNAIRAKTIAENKRKYSDLPAIIRNVKRKY